VGERFTKLAGVAGTKIDLIRGTIESKRHGLVGLAPIEIIDEKYLHLLRHRIGPSDKSNLFRMLKILALPRPVCAGGSAAARFSWAGPGLPLSVRSHAFGVPGRVQIPPQGKALVFRTACPAWVVPYLTRVRITSPDPATVSRRRNSPGSHQGVARR
jgi:hypothetical protein